MRKILIILILLPGLCFGQNKDSLNITIFSDTSLIMKVAMYRSFPYNFIRTIKLQPEETNQVLKDALPYIIAPEEIIEIAYSPDQDRYSFEEFIDKGYIPIIQILEAGITTYKEIGRNQLDKETYEKDRKIAKDSFIYTLKTKHPDWYQFYVVQNGSTPDWYKDRILLADIMKSHEYMVYNRALELARSKYQSPYYDLQRDLKRLKSDLISYRTNALRLFIFYNDKNRIP